MGREVDATPFDAQRRIKHAAAERPMKTPRIPATPLIHPQSYFAHARHAAPVQRKDTTMWSPNRTVAGATIQMRGEEKN